MKRQPPPYSTTQLTSEAARNALALSERMTGRPHPAQRAGLEFLQHRDVQFARHISLQSNLLLLRAFSRRPSIS
jgi:hypothetical protein